VDQRSLEVLERLVAAGPKPGMESVHVAKVSRDFFDWRSQAIIEDVIAQYSLNAEQIVGEIALTWGPPAYCGEVEEAEPVEWAYWRGFCWIAYWQRGALLAFVGVSHQDKELPVFLEFGVVDAANPE
jgi:hypothetical protein